MAADTDRAWARSTLTALYEIAAAERGMRLRSVVLRERDGSEDDGTADAETSDDGDAEIPPDAGASEGTDCDVI